jgi:UDP-glucose 4-epimerase
MKRIVIAGATGYLGGAILEYLLNSTELEITAIGRRSPPNFGQSDRVKYVSLDFTQTSQERTNAVCAQADAIINLIGSPSHLCMESPISANSVYCHSSLKLLNAAIANQTERFIHFSTYHVYSKANQTIIAEDSLTDPTHPYGLVHLYVEKLLHYFGNKKLPIAIIRLANSFGYPHSQDVKCWHLVVNDFCRQAVETKKIILATTGLQYRNFIPLTEVQHATQHLLTLSKPANDIYNLGSKTLQIIELAELTAKKSHNLGFGTVKVLPGTSNDKSEPFNYLTERIKNTGFKQGSYFNQEIELLLKKIKNESLSR